MRKKIKMDFKILFHDILMPFVPQMLTTGKLVFRIFELKGYVSKISKVEYQDFLLLSNANVFIITKSTHFLFMPVHYTKQIVFISHTSILHIYQFIYEKSQNG